MLDGTTSGVTFAVNAIETFDQTAATALKLWFPQLTTLSATSIMLPPVVGSVRYGNLAVSGSPLNLGASRIGILSLWACQLVSSPISIIASSDAVLHFIVEASTLTYSDVRIENSEMLSTAAEPAHRVAFVGTIFASSKLIVRNN